MVKLDARIGNDHGFTGVQAGAQIDKQIEHSVDGEKYLRREREIQRTLERMATKDDSGTWT
ncbi:MAG: hypothetical protein WB676_24660 [Bryobacteraceae bacterium]